MPKHKNNTGLRLYKNNEEYWKNVIQFARRTTMARATRTLIIQGRSETDTLHVSQYIYPIMQVNDILAAWVLRYRMQGQIKERSMSLQRNYSRN